MQNILKYALDFLERCQSGLMCTLGKRVCRKASEVRIFSSPPYKSTILVVVLFMFMRFRFSLTVQSTSVGRQPFCRFATFPLIGESPLLSANRNPIRT